jgi:hypothetical protein
MLLVPTFWTVITTVTGLVDAFTVTVGGWKLQVLPEGRFAQVICMVPEYPPTAVKVRTSASEVVLPLPIVNMGVLAVTSIPGATPVDVTVSVKGADVEASKLVLPSYLAVMV